MGSELEIKSEMNAVRAVRDAFEAIKPHYFLFLAMIAIQVIVGVVASFIPYIGSLLSGAVGACLVCGFFMAVFAVLRGEAPSMSLMFEGFSRFFPVFVFVLLQTIPFVVVASIAVTGEMLPKALTENAGQPITPEQASEMLANLDPRLIWLYLAAWAVWFVMKALMFFAMPFVADREIGASEALGLSFRGFKANVGPVVLLIILQTLMFVGGSLLCLIGLLFVAPVIYASEAVAFRQVFGKMAEPASGEESDKVKSEE